MTSPHPLTDRYLQLRKERRASRRVSFLVGFMIGVLGLTIFEFGLALSQGRRPPLPVFRMTITLDSEGIDI